MTDPADSAVVATYDVTHLLPRLEGPISLSTLPIDAVTTLMDRNGYATTLSGGDPTRQLEDNQALAYRAAQILTVYAADRGPIECDTITVIRDFVNDLHHLTDALGIDWDDASRDYHYRAQIAHDKESR